MGTIGLKVSSFSSITSALARANSVLENAETVSRNARNSLTMEVRSRENIDGMIQSGINVIQKQKGKVATLKNHTETCLADLSEKDRFCAKRSSGVFNTVKTMSKSVDRPSTMASLSHYTKIAGIIMTETIMRTGRFAGLYALLRLGRHVINKDAWSKAREVITKYKNEQESERLIAFDTKGAPLYKGKHWNNVDYSQYKVISGFDSKNVYYQRSVPGASDEFGDKGCAACADAVVGSIVTGENQNPLDGYDKGATYRFVKEVESTKTMTVEEKLKFIYNEIIAGNPCVVRVRPDGVDSGHGTHSVTVIGIRDGADINNLQESDFLIADSGMGDGKTITTLGSGYKQGHLYVNEPGDEYMIRVVKDEYRKK